MSCRGKAERVYWDLLLIQNRALHSHSSFLCICDFFHGLWDVCLFHAESRNHERSEYIVLSGICTRIFRRLLWAQVNSWSFATKSLRDSSELRGVDVVDKALALHSRNAVSDRTPFCKSPKYITLKTFSLIKNFDPFVQTSPSIEFFWDVNILSIGILLAWT